MSAHINDGGPAFPRPYSDSCPDQRGMTLRDYFAAKCVAAMVGTIRTDADYDPYRDIAAEFNLHGVGDWFAREAYKQADAMLRAREAQP